MLCEETRLLFSLYVDDVLSLPARVTVDEHLRQCPVCRAALAELRSIKQRLRALSRPLPPANLASAITEALEIEAGAHAIHCGLFCFRHPVHRNVCRPPPTLRRTARSGPATRCRFPCDAWAPLRYQRTRYARRLRGATRTVYRAITQPEPGRSIGGVNTIECSSQSDKRGRRRHGRRGRCVQQRQRFSGGGRPGAPRSSD